jgi:hypothetical protein
MPNRAPEFVIIYDETEAIYSRKRRGPFAGKYFKHDFKDTPKPTGFGVVGGGKAGIVTRSGKFIPFAHNFSVIAGQTKATWGYRNLF